MSTFRRTKIVSTLGPATEDPQVLEQLILAGVNVVRLNFSHGHADDHRRRAEMVRKLCAKHGRYVAVLGDLQGPKIRIARFAAGKVDLVAGAAFALDAGLDSNAGDQTQVGIDYKCLPADSAPGDCLLLDDGRLVLKVESVDGQRINCRVEVGGTLSNNKGINRQGGGLSAAALTDKDREDIKTAVAIDVDYLAVSFPRCAADIEQTRELVQQAGGHARIVAKVERAEAVSDEATLDSIIRAADAVMVARGDLGVEIGDAALMSVQKHMIERARKLNRGVITATQMMESMITSPMPTRAEVFDVANAVLDGTDAVMLSAETAAGSYPVQTVEAMARVILGAEQHPQAHSSPLKLHDRFSEIDECIALSAMYAANLLDGVKAIICLTETGSTPLLMSRISSRLPIFAFSRHPQTLRRVALFRGVQTVPFDSDGIASEDINQMAVNELQALGVIKSGDLIILSKGDYVNVHGGTNTMKIVRVGQAVK
ncbi:pyruvate kinase [Exilibacterium tricleocarpae]|uniref:Pyruvate kinase n=1 Tax=Exilibacterium tricleocarpae TaxID=2591008 RepID=A0A545SS65_9GAMM|nr:pyruvate kinase [Exilibacterium tricleocarpae]TQV67756.1 pyruvate kinase [Exilibacterium tricleocarpae]